MVVFEGGDGAGKTTQLELLAAALTAAGHDVVTTREPGGTPVGRELRSLILDDEHGPTLPAEARACMFLADRAVHVTTVIRPALERGAVVLCDRFHDSTAVYQGDAEGIGALHMIGMSAWAAGGLLPDLVILLDVLPAVAAARIRQRPVADHIDLQPDAYHQKVRKGFLRLASMSAGGVDYVVLDADAPRAHIAGEVAEAVDRVLALRKAGV
jgi:dTMP kinase